MHPAAGPELAHAGIHQRNAGASALPRPQRRGVLAPWEIAERGAQRTERAPDIVCAAASLKVRLPPLSVTAPAEEPPPSEPEVPLPICNVPPETVVVPVELLTPESVIVPVPAFTRLPTYPKSFWIDPLNVLEPLLAPMVRY